ncbi:hypothetical protein CH063_01013 [Colletotrichum higginsianum]|uniref:Uncharacterized protein n=1 Tax=Colletotrichum higginsianum (strain IMI 349063) TaxID=759273 RepID=H1V0D9_COLHI|nr:hypothetical protein CH063_01013 [Colletotrichum higginsianum]
MGRAKSQLHDRITRGTQTSEVTHSETHHSSLYCRASVDSNSATSLSEIPRCYLVALCLFSGHLLLFAATAVLSLAPIQAWWATPTQKCILSTSQASLHQWPCGSERHSSNLRVYGLHRPSQVYKSRRGCQTSILASPSMA